MHKLIQCEIDKAFTAGVNYTDRKTCKAIYGQVTLPNTPTVTGYVGANACGCPQVITTAYCKGEYPLTFNTNLFFIVLLFINFSLLNIMNKEEIYVNFFLFKPMR